MPDISVNFPQHHVFLTKIQKIFQDISKFFRNVYVLPELRIDFCPTVKILGGHVLPPCPLAHTPMLYTGKPSLLLLQYNYCTYYCVTVTKLLPIFMRLFNKRKIMRILSKLWISPLLDFYFNKNLYTGFFFKILSIEIVKEESFVKCYWPTQIFRRLKIFNKIFCPWKFFLSGNRSSCNILTTRASVSPGYPNTTLFSRGRERGRVWYLTHEMRGL